MISSRSGDRDSDGGADHHMENQESWTRLEHPININLAMLFRSVSSAIDSCRGQLHWMFNWHLNMSIELNHQTTDRQRILHTLSLAALLLPGNSTNDLPCI